MDKLCHHGIFGQRWGIRRYQNKDGTLTTEGRKRLGLDVYDQDHASDIVLKKGTKASRVVSIDRYEEFKNPEWGGSDKLAKKYLNDVQSNERKYDRKYVSVDGIRNSGRINGKDFYTSWFTGDGYEPNNAYITMYELKKDARVASGKQVVDTLIKEVGPEKVTNMLKSDKAIKSLTLDYTRDQNLFNKVNKHFIDMGYDAIEDINDLDTDMPIIVLNSSKTLQEKYTQTGKEALDELFKKYSS